MNIQPLTNRLGHSKAPRPLPTYPPKPGSTPRPFWTVEKGECRFILEDLEFNMSEALTCCDPVEDPEAKDACATYCRGHLKDLATPHMVNQRKPITAKELVRSLRRFI